MQYNGIYATCLRYRLHSHRNRYYPLRLIADRYHEDRDIRLLGATYHDSTGEIGLWGQRTSWTNHDHLTRT